MEHLLQARSCDVQPVTHDYLKNDRKKIWSNDQTTYITENVTKKTFAFPNLTSIYDMQIKLTIPVNLIPRKNPSVVSPPEPPYFP
jgi:hypothetical protein